MNFLKGLILGLSLVFSQQAFAQLDGWSTCQYTNGKANTWYAINVFCSAASPNACFQMLLAKCEKICASKKFQECTNNNYQATDSRTGVIYAAPGGVQAAPAPANLAPPGCPGGFQRDPQDPNQCAPAYPAPVCAPAGNVPAAGQPCCDGNIANPAWLTGRR